LADGPTLLERVFGTGDWDVYVFHVTGASLVSNGGVIDWATSVGGIDNDEAGGIASDGYGGAYVTGTFYAGTTTTLSDYPAVFGATHIYNADASRTSGRDIFVMHVNSSGGIDWVVQAGGYDTDKGFAVAADPAGGGADALHTKWKSDEWKTRCCSV
jgi:hypothetical protein